MMERNLAASETKVVAIVKSFLIFVVNFSLSQAEIIIATFSIETKRSFVFCETQNVSTSIILNLLSNKIQLTPRVFDKVVDIDVVLVVHIAAVFPILQVQHRFVVVVGIRIEFRVVVIVCEIRTNVGASDKSFRLKSYNEEDSMAEI